MLTDQWVITLLLIEIFSLILLCGASWQSFVLVRRWDAQSGAEAQIALERKTYLLSSLVQYVLLFQAAALVFFLQTVNTHLPPMVKGAMCATGTLTLNDYGYFVLILKIVAFFIYVAYLVLHYFDHREPLYPLTPLKYYLVFPATLMVAAGLAGLVLYFTNITPDIIATCCSVTFSAADEPAFGLAAATDGGLWGLASVGLCAVVCALLRFNKLAWLNWVLGLVWAGTSTWALKMFFVKYIYGLPTHTCLFDIFWPMYHYVGYVIFGAYAVALCMLLALALRLTFLPRLSVPSDRVAARWKVIAALAMGLGTLLPVWYWWRWDGVL